MISKEKIARINELAAKAKTPAGLTKTEEKERQTLRTEYIAGVRGQMKNHLHGMTIVDAEGNDVTPQKLKNIKAKIKNNEPIDN
jgi:Uncharacterized protein conserved in bacteria